MLANTSRQCPGVGHNSFARITVTVAMKFKAKASKRKLFWSLGNPFQDKPVATIKIPSPVESIAVPNAPAPKTPPPPAVADRKDESKERTLQKRSSMSSIASSAFKVFTSPIRKSNAKKPEDDNIPASLPRAESAHMRANSESASIKHRSSPTKSQAADSSPRSYTRTVSPSNKTQRSGYPDRTSPTLIPNETTRRSPTRKHTHSMEYGTLYRRSPDAGMSVDARERTPSPTKAQVRHSPIPARSPVYITTTAPASSSIKSPKAFNVTSARLTSPHDNLLEDNIIRVLREEVTSFNTAKRGKADNCKCQCSEPRITQGAGNGAVSK
jgi:hypothetical protein